MNDNNDDNDTILHDAPTRRDTIKYGGVVAAGGLSGCIGGGSEETPEDNDAGGSDEPTETGGSDDEETEDTGYSVTMEPMGTVGFDSVLETWMGDRGFSVDIGIALGQVDGLVAVHSPTWFSGIYDAVPGVSVDRDETQFATEQVDEGLDKEWYYEIDPDLFAMDPNRVGFENDDLNELIENVAPFVGARGRRYVGEDWYQWPDGEPYRWYTLREQVEIYGEVFQEQERAAALNELHRTTIEDIKSRVPDGDGPEIGLIQHNPEWGNPNWVYNLNTEIEETYGKKQYRDLNVTDAFEGVYGGESSITPDFEVLLEHDPDKLFFSFGVDFHKETALEVYPKMKEDPVKSELTAVQNDELYLGGTPYQGPVTNLFQTEMLAKQLYPEEYGEWHGIPADEPWAEIPEDEQLFDRGRLADIINGEI